MRVLLVTHFYAPEIGAPQRRWNGLVRRWVEAGMDLTVVTPLAHYPEGRLLPGQRRSICTTSRGEFGERIIRVPFLPGARSFAHKMADHLVSAASSVPAAGLVGFDVVLTSAPGLPSLVAGEVLARSRRVPHVVEMRDAWPDLLTQSDVEAGRVGNTLARVVDGVQRRADHIVTVSADFATVLRERLSSPRVTHIPNGIDPGQVPDLSGRALGTGPIKALYLGTIGVSQGLDALVTAAEQAGREVVHLSMVGGGNQTSRLQALARERDVHIDFRPQVSGNGLWAAYEQADTVLVPLRDWAAFRYTVPSKLYEIFAVGKHVSGLLSGEARRLVEDASAGVCVEAEDGPAMARLWRAMHERAELTGLRPGHSRRWVEKNANYRVLADRYAELLHRVARRGVIPR